jgi:hypothetical protein
MHAHTHTILSPAISNLLSLYVAFESVCVCVCVCVCVYVWYPCLSLMESQDFMEQNLRIIDIG